MADTPVLSRRKLWFRRSLAALGTMILGLGLVFAGQTACALRAKLKAKVTLTRMRQLEPLLRVDQPVDVSPAALQRFADQNRCHDCTVDAWGNPLIIVREVGEDGEAHYEVRSMGSDGKIGPCCAGFLPPGDYEEDAVLKDDKWLQVW